MSDRALELAASIRARLEELADPAMAAGARNFFREPIDPLGVRSRDLQKVVAEVHRVLKKWPAAERDRLSTLLWDGGKMEEGVLVSHLYRRFAKECGEREFRMFERWIDRYVHNWAHCDGVSSWLLAACIANDSDIDAPVAPVDTLEESLEEAGRRGRVVTGG